MAIDTYLDVITSQHRDKPKFIAWLTANLEIIDDICVTVHGLDDDFDVDNATGVQLDVVGEIVGVNRSLTFDPSDNSSPLLDDATYRFLIKAKIAQNHWKGTTPELYDIWESSFPDVQIKILDNQDMTFTVLFVSQNYTTLQKQLISNGYIMPRPQGVSITYNFNGTFSFRTAAIDEPYTAESDADAGFANIGQTTGGTLGSVSVS